MKAYVTTTGGLFGLLVLAHVWRVIEEGPGPMRDPWFVLFTVASATTCFWAWRLLRRLPHS